MLYSSDTLQADPVLEPHDLIGRASMVFNPFDKRLRYKTVQQLLGFSCQVTFLALDRDPRLQPND